MQNRGLPLIHCWRALPVTRWLRLGMGRPLPSEAGVTASSGASAAAATTDDPGLIIARSLQQHEALLQALADRIRELELETSRLQRKIKEYEQDNGKWSLRYTRRLVIVSNLMLGGWVFIVAFLRCLKMSVPRDSYLLRLIIPSAFKMEGKGQSVPITARLIGATADGVQSSLPFFVAATLTIRGGTALRRNVAFLLSTLCSMYQALSSRKNPRAANYINIFLNLLYVASRYYHLHGLLSFGEPVGNAAGAVL